MGIIRKNKKAAHQEIVIEEAAALGKEKDGINEDLIAVITAAVAAYEAENFKQTLYIKKINRASGTRPVWGVIGTHEAIDVRRF